MRHLFAIIFKIFKKGIALILLLALTIFTFSFTVVFSIYRLVAVVLAAVGTAITVVDCYKYGFTADRGLALLFLVTMITLRYLLPLLEPVLHRWIQDLKDYIYAPLSYRPPVRYTI